MLFHSALRRLPLPQLRAFQTARLKEPMAYSGGPQRPNHIESADEMLEISCFQGPDTYPAQPTEAAQLAAPYLEKTTKRRRPVRPMTTNGAAVAAALFTLLLAVRAMERWCRPGRGLSAAEPLTDLLAMLPDGLRKPAA